MTETSPTSLMSNPNIFPNYEYFPIRQQKSSMIPEISRLEVNVENFYVSGYLLQKGYYKDIKKTNQSMVTDEKGTVWMRTGDEAMIDSQGEFEITGRIKDMIIRGGENIYPGEIEDHLLEHPAVSGVSVVGLSDPVMGQVVAAFLQQRLETPRPSDSEVALWVRLRLGAHKCPSQIFWMGCKGLPDGFPMTESGKVQKNELEVIGNRLIQSARQHRL
ncbi:long-chain-fatty-acid-CoA ligase [Penicillium soppii]|uniref:long-chain-fatty-acid-CoA ligase n=1 Tax=Penicillium soppii TaxID=69789 RepID=UPI0025468BFF|nr:long-chain-fatty-acid-CoA ligase [Penicillium soppii]KAJ5865174.1 long-chain-fatty-acid-CoA ligase [Penicillium soppii]